MNLRVILRYLFAVIMLGVTLWALRWQFEENVFLNLSLVFWLPGIGILLYMATHLLKRTAGMRFYVLQALGVGFVQQIIGLFDVTPDSNFYFFLFNFIFSMISLFLYLNVYIAFLVWDRSPGWMFLVAPVSLILLCMFYNQYDPLWLILPISLSNLLLLLRHKS